MALDYNNFGLDTTAQTDALNRGNNFLRSMKSTDTSGDAGGISSTATSAISSGISTGAQIATSVMANNAQNREIEKASQQDRELSATAMQDDVKQEAVTLSLKKKQMELEEKQFQINKKKQEYDLKLSRFLTNIQNGLNQYNQARSAAVNLQNVASTNQQFRNKIAESFGG